MGSSSSAASSITPVEAPGPEPEFPVARSAGTGEIRKLTTLLETSQALSGTLNLRSALHRVLEVLGRHNGAIRSTVALLQDDGQEIVVDVADGPGRTGAKAARVKIGEGITRR